MQLFFHPDISENEEQVIFSKDESRHIVKVLRKSEGDILKVTNGKGILFTTEIVSASPNSCISRIIETEKEPEPPYSLHLAVAPTKMNDRYEWFLEKATEIGVQEITPVFCDHSERKVVKQDRFERVILSAMKQSLHLNIPRLNEAIPVTDLIKAEIAGKKFIAHCEEEQERKSLKELVNASEKYTILIGPEGDFSQGEIEMARQHGWVPVSLGNSRLRTETAAIVACHTVALAHE